MRLMHNIASLNIYKFYNKNLKDQSNSLKRISSGYKISDSSDNPNDLAKSEKMRMELLGYNIASRNAQDGVSMLQTAEGGLENMTSTLQRIRELIVQKGNGTINKSDEQIIQDEISQLINGYDDICEDTQFNNMKLLCNKDEDVRKMPIGPLPGETVDIKLYNLKSDALGIDDLNTFDLNTALAKIDSAIDKVVRVRSKYGALENRFESSYEKLGEISIKVEGAESSIRDADIAEEMMNYANKEILIQAGTAMMAQSNKFPQDVLRILDNVRY